VAWEVAAALGASLDAFVARKLGAPRHDEFAVGAMPLGGRVAHLVVIQSDATDPAIDGQRAGLLLDLLRGEHATDRPCSSRHSRSTGPIAVMYSRRTRV
jgi:predicted phosphoribosyltransferase